MNKKTSLIISGIFIISLLTATFPMLKADGGLPDYDVNGFVFVDGVLTDGVDVTLSVPGQEDITVTSYYDEFIPSHGVYIISFYADEGQYASFTVKIDNDYFVPDPNGFLIDQPHPYSFNNVNLSVDTSPCNSPPDKPELVSPADNSEDIDLNPILSVDVSDPDDDTMNVSFYNASDDGLIDTDYNVNSGGTATVTWNGLNHNIQYSWYAIASDKEFETKSDTWKFTTTENNPPDEPTEPSPEDAAQNVSINPTLSVLVTDPDGNIMDVSFYNASNDSLIGTATNIPSGDTASVQWTNLAYNTSYSWYAIANDSEFETKSDTWNFTTKEIGNVPPVINITSPEEGSLYIFGFKILSGILKTPLIIGDFTIVANATDEDSGIEKVEFYINGNLMGNDTTYPYTYNWTRDRIRLIHIFKIKVVAYDDEGATAEDSMVVRKFL